MAQIQPRTSGRKAVRYGIPAGVAGVAAVTIGLVPALADVGAPDLPKISAEELVAKMAASDTQHMSGTMKISTDLGLPELPGAGGGSGKQGGGLFGGGPHGDGERGEHGDGKGRTAAPQEKLMELASGEHTLRVAADGPDKQRVSVVEDASEYSFIHNGDEVWTYDSGSDSAFHAKAPEGALAAGDGSIRFREALESAGIRVAPGDSRMHVVRSLYICRLAATVPSAPPESVVPCYLRAPDAKPPSRSAG